MQIFLYNNLVEMTWLKLPALMTERSFAFKTQLPLRPECGLDVFILQDLQDWSGAWARSLRLEVAKEISLGMMAGKWNVQKINQEEHIGQEDSAKADP